MKIVADATPEAAASVSMMDLSLEAEAFGSTVHFSDDEVPTVTGSIVHSEEEADALKVPEIGAGRTQIYIDAIGKAVELVQDRPVFAGVIGPFSLAGRLMDVTEAMIYCYDEPDMVHTVLEKATEFLIKYINAYKAVGANGVLVAEPLAGLLSPSLEEEFSCDYMKKIVEATQTDDFLVCYHNCGNCTVQQIESITQNGCRVLHFGNAIDMGGYDAEGSGEHHCHGQSGSGRIIPQRHAGNRKGSHCGADGRNAHPTRTSYRLPDAISRLFPDGTTLWRSLTV